MRTPEGQIYDLTSPDLVRTQIAAFVDTYNIDLTQLLQPDLRAYQVTRPAYAARTIT